MRWPTFWEAFWFTALLAAPVLGGAVGIGLSSWLGLPAWVSAAGPLLGVVGLFAGGWVLVRLDDRRKRKQAEPGAAADGGGT